MFASYRTYARPAEFDDGDDVARYVATTGLSPVADSKGWLAGHDVMAWVLARRDPGYLLVLSILGHTRAAVEAERGDTQPQPSSGGRTRTPNGWTRTSSVTDYTTPERWSGQRSAKKEHPGRGRNPILR